MGQLRPAYGRMLLLCCCLQLSAFLTMADLRLEKVESQGLTAGFIKCITQDKKGFLWFGTFEGLFRYDGYEFKAFRHVPGDDHTLANNNIEFLYPEEDGTLWVGSRNGLSLINGRSLELKNFTFSEPLSVYSLVRRDDTSLFAGTNKGLFIFCQKTGGWSRCNGFSKTVFIRNITAGAGGLLYIVTHDGFYVYNRHSGAVRHFDLPNADAYSNQLSIAHRSLLDEHGNLWITTWNAGLVRYRTATGELTNYLVRKQGKTESSHITLYDILKGEDGRLWTANSENGVTLFDPATGATVTYPLFIDPQKHIPDRVYSLYKDRTGICWVGTENGIYKADPHKVILSKRTFIMPDGAPLVRADLSPLCILRDRHACWWLGTYEGLYLYDSASSVLWNYSAAAGIAPHEVVSGLIEDDSSNLWVAVRKRMVHLILRHNRNARPQPISVRPGPSFNSVISTLYADRGQRIWIGTHRDGLYRLDKLGGLRAFPANDPLFDRNEIRAVAALPHGKMLIGGEFMGLWELDTSSGIVARVNAPYRASGDGFVTIPEIAVDDSAHYWIATEGSGLWRTDSLLKDMHVCTTGDGLPSLTISHVLTAPNDHVWMITNSGLVDYRPSQKKVTLFGKEAGILNPYGILSLYKLPDGTIVAGDMGCLQIYNGKEPLPNATPPPVAITEFKVLDSSYPVSDETIPRLPYGENYISFGFTALNFTQPNQNRYAYMLEGVDQKWNDASYRRYTSYANLREGSYVFKVRACNNEGVWNDTPATVRFMIRPPFWHTAWFFLLIAAAIAFAVYWIWRVRKAHRLSKEHLRNQIARDLHDDIGSTLSGINIFSRIALGKLHDDPMASSLLLQRIQRRSESTMEALSDIVWSINTREDNMSSIISRMQEFLGEVLEPLGIRYAFVFDHPIDQLHIDMDIRRDIYLIFKEAIHNASKYSGAANIYIELKKQKGAMISMTIRDDGRGFDIGSLVSGNGIPNMQERAARIGAQFSIQSMPGKGTFVTMTFPIT